MASKVHRVRYYNPKPQPINCASINKSTKHLAIARGDASIEIWDVKYSPYLLKFITGSEGGSVEALCWVNARLLSTGLGGALIEWDLETLSIKNSTILTGDAAWCLDVTPDNALAAVGTEQGYINLFTVAHGDIVYKKLFDKQEGRILCCKFNTKGTQLATGSTHTIRVWDVNTGHAISRMSVSRKGTEVIVWCLAFLSDNTVVSGDSLGRLTFWDSTAGEQIESFTTHKADITALAVTENEDNIYCAGVDPLVIRFTKVESNKDKRTNTVWARSVQMNIHEHDVRVLITHNEKLISAGTSGYLVFSSYPPRWVMRVPPMINAPRSSVCTKNKLLLLKYSNHLEVWKLGTYAVNESGNAVTNVSNTNDLDETDKKASQNKVDQDTTDRMYRNVTSETKVSLNIREKPVKLVSVKSKKKKQICCCEMSPSGEFIFYATDKDCRMLKLQTEEDQGNIFVSKLSVSGVRSPCTHVAFTADSRLLAAHAPGVLTLLQLDPSVGTSPVHSINTHKYLTTQTLLHLKISAPSCGSGTTYVVAADTAGGVAVWTLARHKLEPHVTLPTYRCVPSALSLSVDGGSDLLYMVYVDQRIVEYELETKKFKEWPAQILPPKWFERTDAFHSVTRHPLRNALVLQDQNSFWIIEKEYGDAPAPNKMTKHQHSQSPLQLPYSIIPVKYLGGFHWIDRDEALTIELLPGNILALLPPIVAHKRR